MKNNSAIIVSIFSLFMLTVQCAKAQQPAYQDNELTPDLFTVILKDEWEYLRNLTEQLGKETGTRGEFETTPEFQARATQARRNFLDKLNLHIKDTKLDRRVFSVWLKATLLSYNADAELYFVQCPVTIQAPYNIPTVKCLISPNRYIELTDSIESGYRRSNIRFKFDPDFKWTAARSEAMKAKESEPGLFFKVNFILDLTLDHYSSQALVNINPTSISLVNQRNKYIFWKDQLAKEREVQETVWQPEAGEEDIKTIEEIEGPELGIETNKVETDIIWKSGAVRKAIKEEIPQTDEAMKDIDLDVRELDKGEAGKETEESEVISKPDAEQKAEIAKEEPKEKKDGEIIWESGKGNQEIKKEEPAKKKAEAEPAKEKTAAGDEKKESGIIWESGKGKK